MKNLSKSVPDTTHTFNVNLDGEHSRINYMGTFTCKILNRGERALVDKHRALLNGDFSEQLSIETINYHYMVSYLKYALIDVPTFWKNSDYGYALYDENVVRAVYNKAVSFEETWLKEIWGDDVTKFTEDSAKIEDSKVNG